MDKLVVTIAGEGNFNGVARTIAHVKYAGQDMIAAIKQDNGTAGYAEAFVGIYYLDNPANTQHRATLCLPPVLGTTTAAER